VKRHGEEEDKYEKVLMNNEHEGMDEKAVQNHESVTLLKTIGKIEIGQATCETW